MKLKCIILKKHRHKEHDEHSHDDGCHEYIEKHGPHFTDALAEHASHMMQNANGAVHSWTVVQVRKMMDSLDLRIPDTVTNGDVAYLANMYYADMFPDPLKDEASCLKAAHKIAEDIDGYPGMIFNRWLSDVKGKGITIEWKKFI